jgi:hypothetical protein
VAVQRDRYERASLNRTSGRCRERWTRKIDVEFRYSALNETLMAESLNYAVSIIAHGSESSSTTRVRGFIRSRIVKPQSRIAVIQRFKEESSFRITLRPRRQRVDVTFYHKEQAKFANFVPRRTDSARDVRSRRENRARESSTGRIDRKASREVSIVRAVNQSSHVKHSCAGRPVLGRFRPGSVGSDRQHCPALSVRDEQSSGTR